MTVYSLQGFRNKLSRYVNQRVEFVASMRCLYNAYDGAKTVIINGIVSNAWRRPVSDRWGAPMEPLNRIRLELRDVYVNNVPLGKRRRSRKQQRLHGHLRVALSDIVWPDPLYAGEVEHPRKIALGIAGFLAPGLPALDTPPENSKTESLGEAHSGDRQDILPSSVVNESRVVDEAAQCDPQVAMLWFRSLKQAVKNSKKRGYDAIFDESRLIYDQTVGLLQSGHTFREVMTAITPIIEKELERQRSV